MYKHVIPVNIGSDGKIFGGLIKKRNFYEAIGFFLFGFFIVKTILAPLPLIPKTVCFVFVAILPTVIALVGIGDQSILEALFTYIAYRRRKDILPYNIQVDTVTDEPVDFIGRLANRLENMLKQTEESDVYASDDPNAAPEKLSRKELKEARRAAKQNGKTARDIRRNRKKRNKDIHAEDDDIAMMNDNAASGSSISVTAAYDDQGISQGVEDMNGRKNFKFSKEEKAAKKKADKEVIRQMKAEMKASQNKK